MRVCVFSRQARIWRRKNRRPTRPSNKSRDLSSRSVRDVAACDGPVGRRGQKSAAEFGGDVAAGGRPVGVVPAREDTRGPEVAAAEVACWRAGLENDERSAPEAASRDRHSVDPHLVEWRSYGRRSAEVIENHVYNAPVKINGNGGVARPQVKVVAGRRSHE